MPSRSRRLRMRSSLLFNPTPNKSTGHSDEPLGEAIWFFIAIAFPLDTEIATTSYLAITVGNTDWAATVDHALSNLAAFKSRMLNDSLNSTGKAEQAGSRTTPG